MGTKTTHEGEPSLSPALVPGQEPVHVPAEAPSEVEGDRSQRGSRMGGGCDFQFHPSTKRRGEIAEAAFLHKAASLGFSVAKPWGESDRYDFMVDCGTRIWRVQVKSAHSSALNGYSFHACGNVRKNRYTARDIDFIVGYVVPDDVWYVIPIAAYAERTTIKVFPSSKRRMSRFEKYREAWHYLQPSDPCSDAECEGHN